MGLIKSLQIGIGVKSGNVTKGLKKTEKEVQSWAATVGKIATGVAIGDLVTNGITSGLNVLKTQVQSAFDISIRDEQLEVAFGTLLGGAEKAKMVLADLREFGASTPFEFPELAEAGKKLLAFGFDSEKLMPQLRNLGDVAAGLGIPFTDLADIYGKAKVQGQLMSEDLNQLAGRGIPVFDELAKIMGKPAGEMKKLAAAGQLNFGHLQKVFENLTGEGGQFQNMMAAQSQTVGGLLSTLKDNFNLALGEIGKALGDTFDIKGILEFGIKSIQDFMQPLGMALDWVRQFRPVFQQVFRVATSILTAFGEMAGDVFDFLGETFGDFFISVDEWIYNMVEGFATAEYYIKNWEKVGQLAGLTVQHAFVSLGNEITYWFTEALPTVFDYFADEGGEIVNTFAINTLTLFENLGSNIVSIFENMPELIAGNISFDEIVTDLDRGFLSTVENALELPERTEGDFERTLREDLERLSAELNDGLEKHVADRLALAFPDTEVEQELKINAPENALEQAGREAETKFASLAEIGTQEARDSILRFRGLGQPKDKEAVAKEHKDIAKEQLEQMKKLNKAILGQPAPQEFVIA